MCVKTAIKFYGNKEQEITDLATLEINTCQVDFSSGCLVLLTINEMKLTQLVDLGISSSTEDKSAGILIKH